jgi:hypothetical protein
MAMDAFDRVGPSTTRMEGRAMAHPNYLTPDAVTLMLAVVLAAAILMIGSLLMPEVADRLITRRGNDWTQR